MARFSLGGDEDGEAEGSRGLRPHKRPRASHHPRLVIHPAPVSRIEQPHQPPQPLRLVVEEEEVEGEEEEQEESESDSEVDTEELEEELEEDDEDEEEDEEEEERQEEHRNDEITSLPDPPVNRVTIAPSSSVRLPPLLPDHIVEAPARPALVGTASASPTSNPGVQPAHRSISPATDPRFYFTLSDPDVLDCLICYEPLSNPVFQCENGHIACPYCCTKSKNKCPMCSMPIGYNRCRAIERILESIRVSCQNIKHGCKGLLTFDKKNEHEKTCMYSPCWCPHSGCNFVSSSKELYQHFSSNPLHSATRFLYNRDFSITLKRDEKFHLLQAENDGILFIVSNKKEFVGNLMSISCVQPSFRGGFYYDVLIKTKGSSIKFQSLTKSTPGGINSPSAASHVIIAADFFDSTRGIRMDLRIWRNGCFPASIQL